MSIIIQPNGDGAGPEEAVAFQRAQQAKALLCAALNTCLDAVVALDVRTLHMETRRETETPDGPRPAWIKLAFPNEDVPAIKGPLELASATYLLVRIPRAVTDELALRAMSRIIRP